MNNREEGFLRSIDTKIKRYNTIARNDNYTKHKRALAQKMKYDLQDLKQRFVSVVEYNNEKQDNRRAKRLSS